MCFGYLSCRLHVLLHVFCRFNSHSLEAAVQFELIGILLGLAIYNGVLLEVLSQLYLGLVVVICTMY